jgi:hypothetical protein
MKYPKRTYHLGVVSHILDDCRAIAKFKQHKQACFEFNDLPFQEINAPKRKLKSEKNASRNNKKRKVESVLSTKIDESV